MKLFIFICLFLASASVPALAWDDDPWGSKPYERQPTYRSMNNDDEDDKPRRRAAQDDNPFAKSRERGPWHEEPVRKEDRVRTYAPSRVKKEDDPYSGFRTRHNNSVSDGVLRQLEPR